MSYHEKPFESNSQFGHHLRKLRHQELIALTSCYPQRDPWINIYNRQNNLSLGYFIIICKNTTISNIIYINLPMMMGSQYCCELNILLLDSFHNGFWSYRVYNCCFFSTFINYLIEVNEEIFMDVPNR